VTELEQVHLRDGRILDVRVTGPETGVPLVFHHGTPAAATQSRFFERALADRGLRLIEASRAGYGGSTRLAGRSVADVVTDTAEVLEWIGVDRCLVGGWSGGGPHALACAARLEGVIAALVIAGAAPRDADGLDWLAGMGDENIAEFSLAFEGEEAVRRFVEPIGEEMKVATTEEVVAALDSLLPEVDRAVLTGEFGEDMRDGIHEAVRVSVDGWVDDDLAFVKHWGFELEEISVPTMIWHGSEDLMVPIAHGRWLASRVPDATAHLLEGEGHLSVGIGAIGAILDELVSAVAES
jgi:pimeloyl-ACP methyl ester carboxylesterase